MKIDDHSDAAALVRKWDRLTSITSHGTLRAEIVAGRLHTTEMSIRELHNKK